MNKKRLAFSIIFSILFLCFVFIQVPFKEVIHVLVDANPFWLIVAITVLGLTITLTGIRWNQVLHALHLRLPFYQVIRATWSGHFFNTILLGPAAGDVLKSTILAKERDLSLAELLSASWLDRLLAGVGSLVFGLLVLVFTLATNQEIPLELPKTNPVFFVLGAFLLFLLFFIIKKSKIFEKIKILKKLKDSFLIATGKMYKTPGKTFFVIFLGCLGQILLSSVLAWTLASVLQTSLPWLQMLWVFPVIAMLSTLPISIGGVGVREGSSLVLLGTYGVSKPDAVAASLLCLCVYWLLAAVGGILILVGREKKVSKIGQVNPGSQASVQ